MATASDLPIYSTISLSHKKHVPPSKISDNVITYYLWFGPPLIKTLCYAYVLSLHLFTNKPVLFNDKNASNIPRLNMEIATTVLYFLATSIVSKDQKEFDRDRLPVRMSLPGICLH